MIVKSLLIILSVTRLGMMVRIVKGVKVVKGGKEVKVVKGGKEVKRG